MNNDRINDLLTENSALRSHISELKVEKDNLAKQHCKLREGIIKIISKLGGKL